MGAVDLVLQVESPKSVTAGLQRIGRAGHNVGDTSKGRIFPKFRADLLECAVVAQRMREGKIETTVVPRNPLDVLAQQIVAMAATDRGRAARRRPARGDARAHLHVRRAVARAARERARHARRPLSERGVRRAAAADRVGPRERARSAPARARARWRSRTRARSRTAACTRVNLPDGRRVGELDEEMVYEARAGPGVPARRVVVADRGDHARPRDRHARAGRPGRGPVLEGRRAGPAAASSARRSARSRAGPSTRTRRRWPTASTSTDKAATNLRRVPARAAGGDARRAERPHDRDRALPRRDRRLAGVRALPVRRPRARRVGPRAVRPHPRGARPGVGRDLVRRRDHRPPARRRRAARARS